MEQKKQSPVLRIIGAALLLVISILLLVAIVGEVDLLYHDYTTLSNANLTFKQIIRLDFPDVFNPIGPLGAFLGYWIIYIFGKLLGLSLVLSVGMLAFFTLFFRQERGFSLKVIFFIILAFFANMIMLFARQDALQQLSQRQQLSFAGVVPNAVYTFFVRIIGGGGILIISICFVLAAIVVIFEPHNVLAFLKFIGISMVSACTKLFRKKADSAQPEKIKVKPEKKKKAAKKKIEKSDDVTIDDDPIVPEDKKITPNIIDHAKVNRKQPVSKSAQTPELPASSTDETAELKEYAKPDIEEFLISVAQTKKNRTDLESLIKKTSGILESKLAEFGVEAEVINVNIGPIITQYEVRPAAGVKVSKFLSLADDLALAIKAKGIRVQAPIPGRGLVGIEVPNKDRDTIYLKDVMLSDEMRNCKGALPIALGKDISGRPVATDLASMPHLLIAGATGSGKSVCVNTIINAILLQASPDEVRLVLIDPKRIELSGYEGVPHLIQNVVTDNEYAYAALNWAVDEMESRYLLLQKYKVRNIAGYNAEIQKRKAKGEELEDGEIPYIVIVVDEFADLIMTVGKDIERPITRLAQMARAIGIHLILATQRPSSKVITGIIKANFPSRIAFQVSSKVDSRVIIDTNGAEKLLGRGDMLFLPPGKAVPERIHGAYISDSEITELVEYLKRQPKPQLEISMLHEEETMEAGAFEYDDELFPEAACAVVFAGTASVSMLQRHFRIGYARAGRLVDMLEQGGVVGPHVGSKSREVLMSEEDLRIYGYLKD
jgi:S-DNA-T family DNA segregation ATPase FtsK/SpoIIIE